MSLKASTLRLGNLINVGGSSIDTYQTYKPQKVTIELLREILVENLERPDAVLSVFQPIELTNRWLSRLGFRTTRQQDVYGKNRLRIWGNLAGLTEADSPAAHYIPNAIKYVHELQNLYFAMYGEELTLNDPNPLT